MDYTDIMFNRIRRESGLSDCGEDEAAKKRLMESSEPFRKVVGLYERTLEEEKAKGVVPFRKPYSEQIKGLIDIFAELNKFDFSEYDKDSELVAAIHKELTGVTLYLLSDLKISEATRDYLSNHPEVKLYRAKGKLTTYYVGGANGDELFGVEHFLFETDVKRLGNRIAFKLGHRISLGYKIEALSYHPSHPVRTRRFDIREFEELDLKCLELSDVVFVTTT